LSATPRDVEREMLRSFNERVHRLPRVTFTGISLSKCEVRLAQRGGRFGDGGWIEARSRTTAADNCRLGHPL
jgi:hypothetical protein